MPFPPKFFEGFSSFFSRFIFNKPLFSGHIFSPPETARKRSNPNSWDSHDWPANMVIGLHKLEGFKKYKISAVQFLHIHSRAAADGADEAFGKLAGLDPGGIYTKKDLTDRLDFLSSSGYFEKVVIEVKTNPDDTIAVNIPFRETIFPPRSKFRCISGGHDENIKKAKGCLLPKHVECEIEDMLSRSQPRTSRTLMKITRLIENWYHENQYDAACVVRPSFLPREICYQVAEGDITEVKIRFRDKFCNFRKGNTNIDVIQRALSKEVAVGSIYQSRAFVEAQHKIDALCLFSSIEIIPQQDEQNRTMSAEIILEEHPNASVEVDSTFHIDPGRNRPTTMDLLQPSTTILFLRRNIKDLNRSFLGALNIGNLFELKDGIGFFFEYKHPYIDGLKNPRNRTLDVRCFHKRRLSPVFRGESGVEETEVWVERAGLKATITEDYNKHSKFTYGLVMEDIRTRDASSNIVARGRTMSFDEHVPGYRSGPPTTLSGNGVDQMAFLQANLTRDNTRFINGAPVGQRNIFQVDQGIGIGSKFPFFNRHKISATKFIPLKNVEQGKGKSPAPVLVLHGVYGGCVGDLPNYKAFRIGGPHSVRGYSNGEIGASRRKLEVAAEVRVPVKSTYIYAFAEHGNDLGSSAALQGNPTKSYMRKGHGTSYGAGIQLGQFRAEYAVNHNTRKGGFFFHFGDRF